MRSASATASSPSRRQWRALGPGTPAALAALAVLLAAGCAQNGAEAGPERTVMATRKGETSIRVTESEINGDQVVRVKTTFRGEESEIVLNIDQPVYEVEIPLSLEQVMPQTQAAAVRGPEGQFQDLLIAQYLQKAQELMLEGDYNGALRQVNLVLLTQPDHIQAHEMKGSIYYAMGNHELAMEEWEYVLSLDPTNKEVNDFQEFLQNRQGRPQPPLPGTPQAPAGGGQQGAPQQSGSGQGGGEEESAQ